ncbi:MAG: hypothetical protein AABZ60_13955 [Planctomycetota bacterium]
MRNIFFILILFLVLAGTRAQPNPSSAEENSPEKESRYFQNIRQLTFEGKNGEGYFSWDQKRIVFQSIRGINPWYQIYSMTIEGTNLYRISPGKGKTTCSFYHPNGKNLLFASTHLTRSTWTEQPPAEKRGYSWEFDPHMDIFVGDLWGHHLIRLTDTPGYDAEASYSPDGKSICFTSERSGDKEIYVMDTQGRYVKQLTYAEGYDGGSFFSPDNKKVVFRGFRDAKNPRSCHIYMINRDGTNEIQLTTGSGLNWCPYFYPNGKTLIFSGTIPDTHNFELFWMSAEGGEPKRLTFSSTFDGLPVFSPDGKKVLWTSNRVGNQSNLFIADFVPPEEK